ncbi:PREDICTED: tropomyosin-1-like [Nicotiana attenuata]|uniref:tropomyosin-1-like n=1 Tax=Nicotiana attenuata TaxID=49451 RepID=UPI00090540FD|nr:PREDICTED: tropomyosin-1-like [Nicotiana attenuata]
MDEVETPCLFNETQQALNRAEVREPTEGKDAFKLLSEQREGEAKGLRTELEMAQKDHAELVQQKLDVIRQLREEADALKIEAEGWREKMDRLVSEKETSRDQLASAENQIRGMKEEILVQAKKVEEVQSQLGSAVSDRKNLVAELEAAKSEVKAAKPLQFRAKKVAEAAQVRAEKVAEHAKCQYRRETLEKIHARGFDLTTEIESAKELEDEAWILAYPNDDDDSGSLSESESREDPEGGDTSPGDDQATQDFR